jgi:hypothetical protein
LVQSSNSPAIGVVVVVALVVISRLVRRGRLQSRTANLVPGERIRPLAITLLDPLISVVVIGQLVWHLVSQSTMHEMAAIVGSILGLIIGYARARVMFVRAIKSTTSIVLRRSGLEYGLLAMLIILRSAEGTIEHSSSSLAKTVVTGLATLALVEAIARSSFIVKRYLDSPDIDTVPLIAPDPPWPPLKDTDPDADPT